MAFYDATCPRCGKKIRWVGEFKDRKPCHGCGHQLSPEEMAEAERKMKEMEAEIEKQMEEMGDDDEEEMDLEDSEKE